MRAICPNCLSVNNVPIKESYKKSNCGKCKEVYRISGALDEASLTQLISSFT
jgi:phage FluMu protein Com